MSGAKKKTYILHPVLFALFPSLFLFSHNINQVLLSEAIWPIASSLGLAVVLLGLCWLIFRDIIKAGLAVSVFLLFFFSYGHVFNTIKEELAVQSAYRVHAYLMPVVVLSLICSEYFVAKATRNLSRLAKILNVVSITLIVISAVNITVYTLRNTVAVESYVRETENARSQMTSPAEKQILPDIYYIIVDRYSSANILKEFYDFDNSTFIDYLTSRGFYIASESNANYICTAQSLASSLHMRHITTMGKDTRSWAPLYQMLRDYPVWRFLVSKGYKFMHFGSGWSPTSRNKYADEHFNVSSLPEFSMLVYETTLLYPISRVFGLFDYRLENYKRIFYQFDKLSEIPDIKDPTFVFAHFLLPHEPYVVNENGSFITRKEASKKSTREKYVGQILFTNKKLKVLIDKLQSSSDVAPIIVVQSDEGPYPENREIGSKPFNWENASDNQLREKMGILSAYYLPGVNSSILYPSITPVNSFRLIFNLYFGTQFELLPDESYIFADSQHIYKFINVTDKLK